MYRNHKIGLVIPAHNEQRLITPTLRGVPPMVDRVYVVDDASRDAQNEMVEAAARLDPRIVLIKHETNQGPGGAIITGYLRASEEKCDLVAVVGADNQMNLSELPNFLDPLVEEAADYTKGNRFNPNRYHQTTRRMPKIRFLGNWILTAMTKIASGHFRVMDVVDGYTVITKRAIDGIDWSKAWKLYGYPMDFLIRLNAYGFRVLDIPREAIYLPGEKQSQIKSLKYIRQVTPMLFRAFLWRLSFRYLYLDFHPLVFFYFLSFLLIPSGLLFGGYLVADKMFWGGTSVTAAKAVLVALTLIPGTQFLLFAMLFDREETVSWTSRIASKGWKNTAERETIRDTASSTR